jgi:hypothetical protein
MDAMLIIFFIYLFNLAFIGLNCRDKKNYIVRFIGQASKLRKLLLLLLSL